MVIASIDLKGGRVVQLKNGKELMLERDDSDSLIKEFDKYGEVAVIDLDAALRNIDAKGNTANTGTLKKLLRKGNVRVGGGIRDVKKAKELISLGAEKVIIGSAAWNFDGIARNADFLNAQFLEELCAAIGKQRVIIAVDSIRGEIAVKGWTENSGIPLLQGARAAEQYANELLFTCVEREGCMLGADMAAVKELRAAVSCRLVAAGGVSTLEEIIALETLGVDAQLGMALYTGAIKLDAAFIECLNWDKSTPVNGERLIPVIAQSVSGEALMLGFSNKAAMQKTFETERLTFWSRTRKTLWTKGETSGHFLQVVRLRADCDRDTVLATVIPHGGVCHTGSWTCFSSETAAPSTFERLYGIIADRLANPAPGSYTASLDSARVREKIMEEAEELTEASGRDEIVWECADLLYFITVLMNKEGVSFSDVLAELDRRHKK